jgi:hypothetical protein
MDTAAYFIEKATQCRRLAVAVNDFEAEVLLVLAESYDMKAAEAAGLAGSEKADEPPPAGLFEDGRRG